MKDYLSRYYMRLILRRKLEDQGEELVPLEGVPLKPTRRRLSRCKRRRKRGKKR